MKDGADGKGLKEGDDDDDTRKIGSDENRRNEKSREEKSDHYDDSDESEDDRRRKKSSRRRPERRRRRDRESDESDSVSESDSSEEERRRRRRRKNRRKERDRKSSRSRSRRKGDDDVRKKARKRRRSESSSSGDDDDEGESSAARGTKTKRVVNTRLLEKLSARGETMEEREERRAQRRAQHIASKFGYTPEDNPFNDPNLHEPFSWKKKKEQQDDKGSADADAAPSGTKLSRREQQERTLQEIEKVRQRRRDRELHLEEMERLKAEEGRLKEMEHYDEWAQREEDFHLAQMRQRSAIRLVEGRERPIDVLAKNLLLFGLSEEEQQNRRSTVQYQEKFNALQEVQTLEAELQEPPELLHKLKLVELQELNNEIASVLSLERQTQQSPSEKTLVVRYWEALALVCQEEIHFLQNGAAEGSRAASVSDILKLFDGQSRAALEQMKTSVQAKVNGNDQGGDQQLVVDTDYWQMVLDQLQVHLAKMDLSEIHAHMLVRQLETLEERRRTALEKQQGNDLENVDDATKKQPTTSASATGKTTVEEAQAADVGTAEDEFASEVALDAASTSFLWQGQKYRPRKPRYFNRVKTGYDWNSYNKTHYDHDAPPPKIVQGYKFNLFYPDLLDPTKTPTFHLEPSDSPEFCILRFHAGPPYQDVAFKIINRQWNKSRKRGFRCTFERGVLSLYFNFASHWYRR